nr:endonuclease/exonuclease/phosphatase family protein [Phycisphaerae bacterium]
TFALSGGLGVDLPVANTFDRVTAAGLTGVLTYQFGRYVLLVTDPAPLRVAAAAAGADAVAATQAAPIAEPPAADNEWTACTWNAENLFDAVDDGDGDVGDWSPANVAAYRAAVDARARLLREVLGSCTVVGLQEVEGKDAVWADVARALGPSYRFDYWESADVRDLSVGLVYDSRRVELRSSAAAPLCGPVDYGVDVTAERGARVWQSECPAGSYPLYDRPPYVADLVVASAAGDRHVEVRVVVVHLKSKRGDESANLGRRIGQARHVRSLLDAPLSLGLGDFNDDLGSETMRALAGLVNLYERHTAAPERYSYVYQGRAQAVDHVVMTEALDRLILRGGPVHANADRGERVDPADPAARSSDHDPLLVRFAFSPTAVSDVLLSAACGALQPVLPLEVDDQGGSHGDDQ